METKFAKVEPGNIITGVVDEVKKNEVIVHIDYAYSGRIYLNELTKKPVESCEEIVNVGDKIEVVVKKVDDDKGFVWLSRIPIEEKQAFDNLQNYFDNDTTFDAKVLKTTKGGLILSAEGYDRIFMPLSEISVEFVSNLDVYVNQVLPVRVIEIKRNRVVVSHKQVMRDQIKEEKKAELEEITVGDVIEGKVSKIVPYGAFVRFGQVEGLLHISEISHHNVKNVEDVLKEGQTVEVKVIDAKKDKRSLSMKALEKTPWEKFAEDHKVGEEITGKVVKKMQFGMLLEVEKDVVGMINKFDYSWNPRINLAGEVEVGDEIEVKILNIDVKNRKMALSKKHLEYNPWEDLKVKVGDEVSGVVKELQDRGALVEVNGVNAFMPIGEISEKHITNVSEALSEEDVVNGIVLKFDKRQWQMVISKKAYDDKQERNEYKKHLRSENKEDQTQTLGDLFADKLKEFK